MSLGFDLGFRVGMVKAAAGDNQPGPMPGQPQPSDSHRKRNVALGAAVLAGGLFGGRHLYKSQSPMAQAIVQKAKGFGNQARAAGTKVRDKVRDWMKPSRELDNQRFAAKHNIDMSWSGKRERRAKAKERMQAAADHKDRWRRRATKAKWMGAGAIGTGLGALAGGSAASKANEAQDDRQPGIG